MLAERYRFHCTDGQHAVFDRVGRRIVDPLLIWVHADRIAREMMAGSNRSLDWSGWIVDIHNSKGRHVGTLDFTAVREERQAA